MASRVQLFGNADNAARTLSDKIGQKVPAAQAFRLGLNAPCTRPGTPAAQTLAGLEFGPPDASNPEG
jgi:hypothetical protein